MKETPTKFPSLPGWADTANGLHRAAQILGAIRMLTREPALNYLELALRVLPDGLSGEALPSGGAVTLDFTRAAVIVSALDKKTASIALDGLTQASLLERILETLHAQGQPLVQPQDGSFGAAFLAVLHAKHHALDGSLEVTNADPIRVDAEVSARYARVLWRAFTATARWRSRLAGFVTPVVVWAEHFDLSTLWFATDHHDENAPHINFGFAPFDAEFQTPYLYTYASPMPDGFETLPLPEGARWHTQGWKGMVIPYDVLEMTNDPEALIESAFEAVYNTLAPTLRS